MTLTIQRTSNILGFKEVNLNAMLGLPFQVEPGPDLTVSGLSVYGTCQSSGGGGEWG